MKKWVAVLLGVCMLLSCLAFAEETIDYSTWAPEDFTGEVEMWVDGTYESDGAQNFNDFFPNIEMNYVSISSGDYLTKIQTLVASGGELPDIVWLESADRANMIAMDILEDLEAAPYNLDRTKLMPYAEPLNVNSEGRYVAMPLDSGAGGIAYRRSMTERFLGVTEPADVEAKFTSWDDVIAIAEKVSKESNGEVQLFCGAMEAFKLLKMKNIDPYVVDNKFVGESQIRESLELLEKLRDVGGLGTCVDFTPAWHASFGADQYVLWGCPNWIITYEIYGAPDTEGDWGLIKWFGNGYDQGGSSYGITKTSDNKMSAWKYLEWYMGSREGAVQFRDINGTMTCYAPAFEEEDFYSKTDSFFAGQDILATYADFVRNTKPHTATPYDTIVNECSEKAVYAISEGKNAAEAYDVFLGEMKGKAVNLEM